MRKLLLFLPCGEKPKIPNTIQCAHSEMANHISGIRTMTLVIFNFGTPLHNAFGFLFLLALLWQKNSICSAWGLYSRFIGGIKQQENGQVPVFAYLLISMLKPLEIEMIIFHPHPDLHIPVDWIFRSSGDLPRQTTDLSIKWYIYQHPHSWFNC